MKVCFAIIYQSPALLSQDFYMPDWKKIATEMSTILEGIVQDASSKRSVSERSSLLMQKRAGHQKQCLFWDCNTSVPSDHILCRPHWMGFQGDLIDECPGCNRAKDKQYEWCLDCYDGRASQQYGVTPLTRAKFAAWSSNFKT